MLQPPTVLPVGNLTGNDAVNIEGERLGTIASYAIDLEQGRIAYAILSFGGFLGFGDKWFAVPWDAMQFSPHDKKFILNVNKELLEQAPGFDKDNWPSPDDRQFALEVYKYYGRVPYWEQGGGSKMPHQWSNIQELSTMRGKPVYTSDGEKLGEFEEIYHDEATGEPEWIRVKSSGLGGILGTKYFLVSLQGAEFQDDEYPAIRVPYSKDRVQDAPDIDDDWISEEDERRLYNYYGLQYSERRSETQLPEGETEELHQHPVSPHGEVSVSRHEEELQVGKREVEYRRVRLRKWVETEPVIEEVKLRRETVVVQRQPVNRPASGIEIGKEEVEMRLHREEPVVSKETVEREQITVHVEEETEKETVHGEVRREHVEAEDDSGDSHEGQR
jgi:sporulation protein YlmC with PRC-barrel domain/stress response protein YsnF